MVAFAIFVYIRSLRVETKTDKNLEMPYIASAPAIYPNVTGTAEPAASVGFNYNQYPVISKSANVSNQLPGGWSEHRDASGMRIILPFNYEGNIFYYNANKDESTWLKPVV